MRVAVQTIVSERDFGTILSARVEDFGHPLEGDVIRVKASAGALVGRPAPGEVWDVEGEVRDTSWGPQIETTRAVRVMPSGRLVRDFLAAHAPGVGPERAEALWQRFGVSLGDVLSSEDSVPLLAPVLAPDRSNLAPRLAVACVRAWREAAAQTRAMTWLAERGVEDVRIAMRVAHILGPDAVERVADNPYMLVALLPWSKVDELGLQLLAEAGCHVPRRDPRRLVGAVDAVVKRMIADGHTAIPDEILRELVGRALGAAAGSPLLAEAVAAGERNGAIIPGQDVWRAPGCATMESAVAERLHGMLSPAYPSPVEMPTPKALAALLEDFVVDRRSLHPEQQEAVQILLRRPLGCLQGGAGVGKTTTIKAVCDLWERQGGKLVLCALAGKAALRLSQSTKRLAMTLARLLRQLEMRASTVEELSDRTLSKAERERSEKRLSGLAQITPKTLVVVDESSMVDLATIHALLRHMPQGARLLLVGDEAQLPPVGFGLVYHRLVADAAITARLSIVHRQGPKSGIPAAAAALRDGHVPVFADYVGIGEGVSMVEVDEADLPATVERVWCELGGRAGETLIVAATHKGGAGIEEMNRRLHARHVQTRSAAELKGHLGQWFSSHDPVVWLRNDYERGLFNGLLGHIVSIDCEQRSCLVQFDGYGEAHEIGRDDLIDLALAYAITCHRAQGSQVPSVVVPLYRSQVLDPSWLYTAVTRAERQVVLVGARAVLQEALARPWAARRRRVGFAWRGQ
ncbi:hypothetical protein ABAZ39_11530 [Azospirillum argentinense]|uniref:Uncharacterized protein n=1 Tax=Azospirillum argentinense TaxID=2970906 RepID=A0A060DI81_9PROT|nr:AAA family ATPase [Azospirillum argentinense]AIB12612.1 hypothetical protein ABAZ39_11530 [Azospirillum argentinense]EZQ09402.1 hypothetical protein ABAZ39_12960 [Azospirillum argentinense]